jgi:arginyl-tRNA synthetase
MGDLACVISFDLAKHLKKAPRKIAEEIVANFALPEYIESVRVEGGGYINFFFKKQIFLQSFFNSGFHFDNSSVKDKRVIVEHTSVNPNKTPHIGHLRNSVIGDTFARLCKALGYNTIVQNYIDNTGVQVADVVIGLTAMRGLNLDQIRYLGDGLDRFCWEVYAEVGKWYEDDPNRKSQQTVALKEMEEGYGTFADVGEYVSSTVTRTLLNLMEKLGIKYDLIVWERDVLALDLWLDTFKKLKDKGKLFFPEDGEKRGCWVMDLKDSKAFSEMDDPDKILVRSNGTITYTAKDIAYHFWKCGLLEKDFQYQTFYEYRDSGVVWTTTCGSEEKKPPITFNSADIVINVIDERQSYPQKVVQDAVRTVNADIILKHFAYGMVALSPVCAEELGIELTTEEKGKKYIEMSGRRGFGVKADDLIDTLNQKARERIRQNLLDLEENAIGEIAEKITIGALRYFLIKFNKNKVIAFDFDEALNFEGDAGPYIQYSIVRSGSIIKKAVENGVITEAKLVSLLKEWDFKYIKDVDEAELTWEFLFNLSRFDDISKQAFNSLDLSLIAGWAYDMAQSFNSYYHKYSILKETDKHLQLMRLGIVLHYKNIMTGIAGILGLPIPDKM